MLEIRAWISFNIVYINMTSALIISSADVEKSQTKHTLENSHACVQFVVCREDEQLAALFHLQFPVVLDSPSELNSVTGSISFRTNGSANWCLCGFRTVYLSFSLIKQLNLSVSQIPLSKRSCRKEHSVKAVEVTDPHPPLNQISWVLRKEKKSFFSSGFGMRCESHLHLSHHPSKHTQRLCQIRP